MFGHLNNAIYYPLFDTAINAWINTGCGIDPVAVSWLGRGRRVELPVLSELKFPDPLVVGLGVTRLGNSSVTYRTGLSATAVPSPPSAPRVHVYVDRKRPRRPVPIPDEIRALMVGITTN